MEILKLLRPHQYIKNGFVLIGVIFSGQYDKHTLFLASLAFLAFCAIASAVYIFNDIFDAQADREHPAKKYRPIVSGTVALSTAWLLAVVLACFAFIMAYHVSLLTFNFILIYVLMNIGYSLYWKRILILDVFIISAGFMLRILVGTVGIDIPPSSWLLLCGFMLTLFLGFSKRRAELILLEHSGRKDQNLTRQVTNKYSPAILEHFISISAACTILSYSLYTVSQDTVTQHGTDALIYTMPFVVYGIYRYIYLLHQDEKGDDTAKDLYTDWQLLSVVLGWVIVTLVILM